MVNLRILTIAMGMQNKIAFDFIWVIISQIVTLTAGFFLNIILGIWLGPSAFGIYSVVYSIYFLVAMVAGFGIPLAIIKFTAEEKDNPERLNGLMTAALSTVLVLGICCGGALFLMSDIFAATFQMDQLSLLLKIIAVSIPLFAINSTFLSFLNGLRDMKSYSIRSILRSVLLIVSAIALLALGWGVMGAVLGIVISEVGTFFLLSFMVTNRFSLRFEGLRANSYLLVHFGGYLLLANAIYMLNTYLDTLLTGFFLSATDVGLYAIAITIARTGFLVFPMALSILTYPMISERFRTGLDVQIKELMDRCIRYTLVLLSVTGLGLIFFAQEIIVLLFRSAYAPATPSFIILLFGMMFFGPILSVGAASSAMNRPDISFKVNCVICVLNVLLNAILIPQYGIVGAAIASSASFILLTFIFMGIQRKVFNIRLNMIQFVQVIPIVLVMAVIFYSLKGAINSFLLGGSLLILFTGYLFVLFFTEEERVLVWDALQKLKGLVRSAHL
jgi:stage V sporulation protein B